MVLLLGSTIRIRSTTRSKLGGSISVAIGTFEQLNDNYLCSRFYRYDTRHHLQDRGRRLTVEVHVKAFHRNITLIKPEISPCSCSRSWNTILSIFVAQSIFRPSGIGSVSYHSIVEQYSLQDVMLTSTMLTNHERAHHHSLYGEYSLTIHHLRPAHTGTAATFDFFGSRIVETVSLI